MEEEPLFTNGILTGTGKQNDLMVYEEGAQISTYTYGLDRISVVQSEYESTDPLALQSHNIQVKNAMNVEKAR